MPSLDLYNSNANPDGWHDVRAPGGYEWWYFDAEDPATDTQLVAIFMQGFIFHPGYLRAYKRYRRRPTRRLPPTPTDFPSVYFCIYRGGKGWQQFFTEYRREQFKANAHGPLNVSIGPNRLRSAGASFDLDLAGTPWTLTARGPRTHVDRTLSAHIRFSNNKPIQPTERTFLSEQMTGATHRWAIAAPSNGVEGQIQLGGETLNFTGRGYHDHNFGTAPIGDGLRRWIWGRAMFDSGRVVTFHHAQPLNHASATETHLVEVQGEQVVERHVEQVSLGDERTSKPAMMLRFPSSLDFGETLQLTEPRVIDPSPFYLRLQYTARSFGERTTAFCELAYPHRVRWPILGRMIEMSFDKRQLTAAESTNDLDRS